MSGGPEQTGPPGSDPVTGRSERSARRSTDPEDCSCYCTTVWGEGADWFPWTVTRVHQLSPTGTRTPLVWRGMALLVCTLLALLPSVWERTGTGTGTDSVTGRRRASSPTTTTSRTPCSCRYWSGSDFSSDQWPSRG